MQTDQLRQLVQAAAVAVPGARLWPNGIGFDGTCFGCGRSLRRIGS